MQEQFGDAGLVVVGVTAADAEAAQKFRTHSGADYPILVDALADMQAWGVKSVPTTFLLDSEGRVLVKDDLDESIAVLERAQG